MRPRRRRVKPDPKHPRSAESLTLIVPGLISLGFLAPACWSPYRRDGGLEADDYRRELADRGLIDPVACHQDHSRLPPRRLSARKICRNLQGSRPELAPLRRSQYPRLRTRYLPLGPSRPPHHRRTAGTRSGDPSSLGTPRVEAAPKIRLHNLEALCSSRHHLREADLAALEIGIEVDRDRKAPMGRALGSVVTILKLRQRILSRRLEYLAIGQIVGSP